MSPDILSSYDNEERKSACWGDPSVRSVREGSLVLIVGPTTALYENTVVYSNLTETNADAEIERAIDYFAKLGRDFEWKYFTHDRPADLDERLIGHGLVPQEPETVMVWDFSRELGESPPPGITIEKVTGQTALTAIALIQEKVWGNDGTDLCKSIAREEAETPDRLSIYVARAGQQVVACGWLRFPAKSPFAGLYGGSTLKEFRGRGIYRALVAARVKETKQCGYRYAVTDAGPMSCPVLERVGFIALTRTIPFWSRNSASV